MTINLRPSIRQIEDRRAITAVEHVEDLIDAIRCVADTLEQGGDVEAVIVIATVFADAAAEALPGLRTPQSSTND